jgi:glycosyltransferase involved in cell wall biosynthesis
MSTFPGSPSVPPDRGDGSGRGGVLFVAPALDPVGSGRQLELLATGLARRGRSIDVAFLTARHPRPLALPTRLAAGGVQLHDLATRPVVDAAVILRVIRLAARLRPATVVVGGRRLVPLAATLRATLRGVPIVGQVGVPVRHREILWGLRRLDRVVASSERVAATCAGAAVEVIAPGIEADPGSGLDRAAVAARLGLDPGTLWTLCVAPLEPEARIERLLWAIDQLGVVHRGLEHVLVGDGPHRRRVRRRAHVQELDDRLVVVPGCDILPDLLGQVRLVWQSGEVACGGAVLDGMARGVPAVMVESDAARQLVIPEETGRVVPALPESELPRRTLAIIEDDALAARLGGAAADRAAQAFPAARMIDAWEALLDRIG